VPCSLGSCNPASDGTVINTNKCTSLPYPVLAFLQEGPQSLHCILTCQTLALHKELWYKTFHNVLFFYSEKFLDSCPILKLEDYPVSCPQLLHEGERLLSDDLDIGWRTILKWILNKHGGSVDCIKLTYDTDQWQGLVNTVMNF
jgi:hypothetical protein